jgi:hypothetical protein
MWWLMACIMTGGEQSGVWTFKGEDIVGQISHGTGCDRSPLIGIWGPRWGTDGMVNVELVEESEGVWWAHFPVEIGLGVAMAALRIEGGAAEMPLGARAGEFSVSLRRSEGSLDPAVLQEAQARTSVALELERTAWQEGLFVLMEQDTVVGEVQFRGERPPLVAVYDSWWLTPSLVPADVVPEGADLVLRFSVEPAMAGEDGELRINVPLREVVVPMGEVPVAEERRFRLVPGGMSEVSRQAAMDSARDSADRREADLIGDLGAKLGRAAKTPGGCLSLDQVDPAYGLLLTGYQVQIVPEQDSCVVEVEPSRAQHGRRFKGRIGQH